MNVDREELLSALHGARGKGLSLKQLAGHLRLGHAAHKQLRRELSDLLKEGRRSFDGHVYREQRGSPPPPQSQPRDQRRPQPRRAPAALLEGARQRREKKPAGVATKPGAQVTGVIHIKQEGYGFVTPLIGGGGRENDLFVPPQFVMDALDGDVGLARAIPGPRARPAAATAASPAKWWMWWSGGASWRWGSTRPRTSRTG